jgi:3-oxoadipate enol-lactonase
MSSGLHVVRAGAGPQILLIHGSAADHRTWSIQLASPLRTQFTLIAYDRRPDASVEHHADDAAAVLAQAPGPTLVIGSSFGAVIALDLVRRHPAAVAGAVLIEPPLAASDEAAPVAPSFLPAFDGRAARDGGPAAGELFLRTVLGHEAFDRMPRVFQAQATAKFAEIRADTVALLAYRPRYAELAAVTTPLLLVGGERSAPSFRATLDALHAALPAARLEILSGAGHMLHAEAPRRFHALVTAFAAPLIGSLTEPPVDPPA